MIQSDDLKLLSFQKIAVKKMMLFLNSPIRGVYNACEMRLGKTVQAIACLNELKCRRILIICPAVVREVWREHLTRYLKRTPHVLVVEKATNLQSQSTYDTVICSYDLMSRDEHYRHLICPWDCIILDEAHRVKTPSKLTVKGKITRGKGTYHILEEIWPQAKYHIALSGTPCTKHITDAFTLFNKFLPTRFPNYWQFAREFSNLKRTPWADMYVGIKNEEELKRVIYANFFVRYRRVEIEKELPEKVYQQILLGSEYLDKKTKEEEEEHQKYIEKVRKAFAAKSSMVPVPPLSVVTLIKRQGEKKVKAIADIAKEYLDASIPIVIFMVHIAAIELLAKELKKYVPSIIHGSISSAKRTIAINRFQDGTSDVFIGQIQAAGVGISLSRSTTVLLGEFHHSPAIVRQAVARVEKMNSKNSVHIIYPVVRDSVEENIISIMMKKLIDLDKAFNT